MATINRAEVLRITRSPSGPAGRDLTRRGTRVESRAKTLCPVDTGRLRSTINATTPRLKAQGLFVRVGTNVVYGLPVHEGAGSPHAPRSWRVAASRGGGPPPRRFLVNALPAMRG